MTSFLKKHTLHLADNALILGHRLSEWCGHGPVLEQDIALSNIALDLIGQARNWYQLSAKLHEEEVTEDDLAYLRKEREYLNVLLVELPNQDFGYTIVRQFLWDTYHHELLRHLCESTHSDVAAVAKKSIKEVSYHNKWSAEWLIRLGDGTEESYERVQKALDDYWSYGGEVFMPADYEIALAEIGVIPNPADLKDAVNAERLSLIERATLTCDVDAWQQKGGKQGIHTEHMGYFLADHQYMQRTYPGATW